MTNDDDLNNPSYSGDLYKSVFGSTPLFKDSSDSPLYSDILNDTDLSILTADTFPGSYDLSLLGVTAEELKNSANRIRTQKINPYKNKPIPFNEQLYFPEFFSQKQRAEEGVLNLLPQVGAMSDRPFIPDSALITDPSQIRKPIGYDKVRESLRYGVDPRNTFEDASLRSAVAFYTGQNPTPEDLNYMFDNFKFPGRGKTGYRDQYPNAIARYINPNNPKVGIRIDGVATDANGNNLPLTFDAATVTGSDVGEFALDEFLPMLAEGTVAIAGLGKKGLFNEFLRNKPKGKGWVGKAGDSISFNALLAASSAGTRFLQRVSGLGTGAHNKSPAEILEESGVLFAFSFLGNQGLDILLQGMPKIYRTIAGKDIGANDLREIEEAWKNYQTSAAGKQINLPLGEKEPFTIQEIREAAERLGVETFFDPKEVYKPSLSRGSRSEWIERIERALLSEGNQADLAPILAQLGQGDAKFTKEFFSAMFKSIDENVTGATIGPEIRAILDDGEENFVKEGQEIFSDLRQTVKDIQSGNVDNLTIIDEQASDRIIKRTNNRVQVVQRQYLDETTQNVENAFIEAGIDNVPITTRTLSTELKNFKAKGDKKIKSENYDDKIDNQEYYDTFQQLIPDEELFTKWSNNQRLTINDLIKLQRAAGRASGVTKSGAVKSDLFKLQSTINNQVANSLEGLIKNGTIDRATKNNIIDNLVTANSRYNLANTKAVIDLAKAEPEELLSFISLTQRKGVPTNDTMREVVHFLKDSGDTETLNLLRNTLTDNLQQILDNPGNRFTGEELAKNYKKFLDQFGPSLKELFEGADLNKIYKSPLEFENQILKPLERLNRDKKLFTDRFGQKSTFNIITDIVGQSSQERLAGKTIQDLDFLMELIDGNNALKADVANAYKLYVKGTLQDSQGNLSISNLKKLLEDGHVFGTVNDASNLSARNFHQTILGGDNEFTTNLFILEDLIAKSRGVMGTYGDLAGGGTLVDEAAIRREMIKASTDPKINYLKRFFIPPLTQTGRRATLGENIFKERTLKFLGKLVTEPELINSYLGALRGRNQIAPFIKILNQVDSRLADDVEFGLSYYDSEKREPKERDTSLFLNPRLYLPFGNSRINQIMEETANE